MTKKKNDTLGDALAEIARLKLDLAQQMDALNRYTAHSVAVLQALGVPVDRLLSGPERARVMAQLRERIERFVAWDAQDLETKRLLERPH